MSLLGVVGLSVALLLVGSPPAHAEEPGVQDSDRTDVTLLEVAEELVTCTVIDGENFCLFVGFTDMTPGDRLWIDAFGPAADDRVDDAGGSLGGYLREVAQLPIEEREALAARSLKEGYETVGKLKLYDHVGLDIPIPAGFFETYPQLGIAEDSERADALRTAAATGEPLDLSAFVSPSAAEESEEQEHWGRISSASAYSVSIPDSRSVPGSPTYRYLFSSAYREQVRNDYCGPATYVSIDGADDGGFETQNHWSSYVGYHNSDGTYSGSVYKMRDTINSWTNWDSLAGTYAVIPSDAKGASWYFDVHQINIGLDGAPVVEHVKLLAGSSYYSYMQESRGGHFQTGRGYSRNSNTIAIFEPYDERDWDTDYPTSHTGMIQYVPYANVYLANQAYPASETNILG
jgi:hypothetical protein